MAQTIDKSSSVSTERSDSLGSFSSSSSISLDNSYLNLPNIAFTNEITFYLNGVKQTLKNPSPDGSLSDFIRSGHYMNLTGTKIGCNEGGCGACTVVIGSFDSVKGKVFYKAVNSCIVPLLSIDGKHLITVEGLGTVKKLHPVQERLAKFHGSQCGFCTPGIIMSVYGLLRNDPHPTKHQILEALDGNLCRCTGYITIIHSLITFARDYSPETDSLTDLSKSLTLKEKGSCGGAGGCGKGDDCCQSKKKKQTEVLGCGKENCCQLESKETTESASETDFTFFSPNGMPLQKYNPVDDLPFPKELLHYKHKPVFYGTEKKIWIKPTTLTQLLSLVSFYAEYPGVVYKLVSGSSEFQVENYINPLINVQVLIYINDIPELNTHWDYDPAKGLTIAGNFTLSNLEDICEVLSESESNGHDGNKGKAQVFDAICKQLKFFAGRQIRNAATAPGNIVTASPIADLNPCLVSAGAHFTCKFLDKGLFGEKQISLQDFFVGYRRTKLPPNSVITSIFIPNSVYASKLVANESEFEYIKPFKQSKRKDDDISIVTACLRLRFRYSGETESGKEFEIVDSELVYGGMAPMTVTAKKTNENLVGKKVFISTDAAKCFELNNDVLESAIDILAQDFNLPYDVPGGMSSYRRCLTVSFFYKFFQYCIEGLCSVCDINESSDLVDKEALKDVTRAVATGNRDLKQPFMEKVVGHSNIHMSALKQVTGEAIYTEDIPIVHKELHGALVKSTKAHAKILSVDYSEALKHPGIAGVVDINDIDSEEANLWGNFDFGREEFFADGKVYFYGQTIALIVGEDRARCYEAAKLVKVEYEELPRLVSIEDAIEAESYFPDHRITEKGDWEGALKSAAYVFEGTTRIGAQEQFYFETQNCLVVPEEDGELKVYASTQNPTETQEYVSHITGIPASKIVVRVKRMGGGFGGKETRSVPYTSIGSVAALKYKRPVRIALNRQEDMLTSGQRHPFLMKWKVGLDKDMKFIALDAKLYANAGWSMDLTRGVIDRAVFHAANCYNFPNARVEGIPCKTNTISNTAFRTFGGVQGCYLGESIIYTVSEKTGITPEKLRELNYLHPELGDTTTYKQHLGKDYSIPTLLEENRKQINYDQLRLEVEEFNKKSKWIKRGLAQAPVMFGVSFGVKFLNQAGALVHVYKDGSILVSHGGTEMGQGLHTKMAMIAAEEFGVSLDQVFISETSTQVVANTSATAASASSDLNGMAVKIACEKIMRRLKPLMDANPESSFKEIVSKAYFSRINLSANGFYKTPDIDYEWGHPNPKPAFFYYTQGAAASLVELDTLTGDWACLRTDIKMDLGRPINQAVDLGQIEGAFVQGMGLMTMEQSLWSQRTGGLATTGPGAYKIPGFNNVPHKFNVSLLYDRDFSHLKTVKYSKGIGEPPLVLGMVVQFALRDALNSARKDHGITKGVEGMPFISPMTTERLRVAVGDKMLKKVEVEPKGLPFFIEA